MTQLGKYGSRKFLLALALLAALTWLRVVHEITEGVFGDAVRTLIWAYMTGNVSAEAVRKFTERKDPAP